MYGDLDLPYYTERLKEAEGDWEDNRHLFDEETQQRMKENIEELREKIAKLTFKGNS